MNSKTRALIGFIICLPGAILLMLLIFNIEPNFGPLQPLVASPVDGPTISGSVIALAALVILPSIAFILNLVFVLQTATSQNNLAFYVTNIAIVIIAFTIVVTFISLFAIDQYPCWIGIPYCD